VLGSGLSLGLFRHLHLSLLLFSPEPHELKIFQLRRWRATATLEDEIPSHVQAETAISEKPEPEGMFLSAGHRHRCGSISSSDYSSSDRSSSKSLGRTSLFLVDFIVTTRSYMQADDGNFRAATLLDAFRVRSKLTRKGSARGLRRKLVI
jgi:hypothetical protein